MGEFYPPKRKTQKDQKTRVGLYARVSTSDQHARSQLLELKAFCHARGWDVVTECVDEGISGIRDRRPQLDKLMRWARARKLDVILVSRYDRFARSLRHLVTALEEFNALGVDFVSVHEGTDTSTPTGKLLFNLVASMAEFERELIRERVKAGLVAARAAGVKLGRPRLTVDADHIRAIRATGVPWREIGKILGIAEGTARRRAKNPSDS